MKNIFSVIILSLAFSVAVNAQLKKGQVDLSKVPVPKAHYKAEYTFDVPVDNAIWTKQKSGLNASFVSTDELYMRCEVPSVNLLSGSWETAGWRGERLNAEVLVWSPDTIQQVRFYVSDLKTESGKVIGRENIKIKMVRYVLSNLPYNSDKFDCGAPLDTAWLMPDRFENFDRFYLPGKTVRPVWISLDIPRNSEPGKYSGTIELNSKNGSSGLKMNIVVQNQILPVPHDWKFRLDLWQTPMMVADYYHVKPWSDEHMTLLKQHLKLYADGGGKFITTYAVPYVWGDICYRDEGTMIDWILKADGSWKFDYSIFDTYVQLATEAGVDKAITIYSPTPWGQKFTYLEEKSGNLITEEWKPDSEKFRTMWNIFLNDLKVHLTKKGWFDKTYLGINENSPDMTLVTAKIIKANSKDWKITYAGDWHPELSSVLDDYSPIISSEPNPKELQERTIKGQTTTFYICCTPVKPNNFVFSPPVEGRFIGWYASAYGYNGFLRWALDSWPADPVRDARHTNWSAGDCFMIYPGGNSGIRFEKLREGIVDFEKIRILRDAAAVSINPKVKSLIKDLDAHLASLTSERDYSKRNFDTYSLIETVKRGNKIIIDLSDALGSK